MEIPDEIRKCVAFVGCQKADGRRYYLGTAFFVGRRRGENDYSTYLVTAGHVIRDIESSGSRSVLLRVNRKQTGAEWISTRIDDWTRSADRRTDVALIPHQIGDELDHLAYPLEGVMTLLVAESNRVGVGDDVFFPGLFSRHTGLQNNIPIVRIGNIAAMPHEKVDTSLGFMDAYLIEARSIGGLSGSPVFVYLGGGRRVRGFSTEPVRCYLIGLVHGHFRVNDSAGDGDEGLLAAETVNNMGIAIVVPVDKVLDLILQTEKPNP